MDSCYANTLKVCIPVLGLCSAGIQLSTIHARFVNATPSSPEAPDWPLRKVQSVQELTITPSNTSFIAVFLNVFGI